MAKKYKQRKKKTIFERFIMKVKFSDPNDCWLWLAGKDKHGYGHMSSNRDETPLKTHRVSFQLFKGKIPEGAGVLHNCDNPSCVNPNHLRAGTQKDNMQDASKRNRLNAKSLLNLRPGEKNYYGAGSKSNKELKLCQV